MNSFSKLNAVAALFRYKRLVLTGVFLFFVGFCWIFGFETNTASAANCTSAGSGNWTEITWTNCTGNPGGDPISTDTVTIANGHAVTLDTNATIAGLTITPTSANSSLTHGGTNSLTVNGTVTLNQGTNANITSSWNINAGTGSSTGLVTLAGTSTTSGRTVSVVITTGTANFDNGLSTNNGGAGNKILDMSGGAGLMNFKGNFTGYTYLNFYSGTSSTFNFADTSNAQYFYDNFNSGGFHDILISNTSSGGANSGGAFTSTSFSGDLTVASGALFRKAGSFTLDPGQTLSIEGNGVMEITGGSFPTSFSTFDYSAAAIVRYTINSYITIAATDYPNLELKSTISYYSYTFEAGTVNVAGDLTLGNGSATLYIYASTNSTTINITGSFIDNSVAYFTASSGTLTIGNDMTINGNFAHNNGTVVFNDAAQTSVISGSFVPAFYNFVVTTPNKAIQFQATQTFRFANSAIVTGTPDNNVSISSDTGSSQWLVDFDIAQTSFDWDYVTLQDSGCGTGTLSHTLIHSDNISNNNASCWTFLNSMTVSGNVYNTKANAVWTGAGKCDDSTQSIAISVNGGTKQNVSCDSSTGAYSFDVDPASDVIVAVWMDTAGGDKGVVYTRTGITNVTGLSLYKNQVRLGYSSGGSLTNANINIYDSGNDPDIPIASDGVSVVVSSGVQLTVVSGKTYVPGGNVTTPALEVAGTYQGVSETLTITGSGTTNNCSDEPGTMQPICVNGGLFKVVTNTVDFTTTSATNIPNLAYFDLRFLPVSGSPTYTLGTGNYQSLSANDVTVGNGVNAVTLTGATYTTSIFVDSLTIATNASYDVGSGKISLQDSSVPLTVNGTLDVDSATVIYASLGDYTVPAGTFYNLQIAPSDSDATITLGIGTFTVNNNFIVGSEGGFGGTVNATVNDPTITVAGDVYVNSGVTFITPDNTLNVNGNWANYGILEHGTGTVQLNATTDRELLGLLVGPGKFNNLTLSGSGGIWTASGDVEVEGDLTLTAGTFSGAGNLTVNGGSVTGTGTVMFSGNSHMVNIASMSAGDFHTCAVNVIGDAYCWGSPGNGVLGDGQSSVQRQNPVRVLAGEAVGADTDGTYLTNIKSIHAGTFNTCAVSYAGNAYCWGWANNGQVGDNQNSTSRTTPVRVHDGEATGSDTDGTYLINIDQIDIELYHACALAYSGKMYCWGSGGTGELGDGQTSSNRLTPVLVQDGVATGDDTDGTYLTNIKSITVGYNQTCTINFSSYTYCWGYANYGSVGDEQTITNRSTPVRVHDGQADGNDTDGTYLVNMKKLDSSNYVVCAISETDKTYCWGRATYGHLGDNQNTTNRTSPVKVQDGAATGADTDGTYLVNLKEISVGSVHVCTIANSGYTYCWGSSSFGALGDGVGSSSSYVPKLVVDGDATGEDSDGTYLINQKLITTGQYHACTVSYNDKGYCWGSAGQIAWYSQNSSNPSAGRIQSRAVNFLQTLAGYYSTCSITTSTEVYCSSLNSSGQLGDGSTAAAYYPVQVLKGEASGDDTDGTYLKNIKEVVSEGSFHCALAYSSKVYCWGAAAQGQLGDEQTATNRTTPVLVHDGAASGPDTDGTYLTNIRQITAGSNHTCAISYAGNTYCWGYAASGQLGDSQTASNRTSPVKVQDGAATGSDTDGTYLVNIRQITAGWYHTCAVSNSGNTYCWGEGDYGVLGDNQAGTDRTTPVRVEDGVATGVDSDGTYLKNIKQIDAGGQTTCAISFTEATYCWGIGSVGQNGQGVASQTSTPVRVQDGDAVGSDTDGVNLQNLRSISVGYYHVCAVSQNNNPYCWGFGYRYGINDSNSYSVPKRPLAGQASGDDYNSGYMGNVRQISAGTGSQFGAGHTVVVTNSGNIYAAGCCNSQMFGMIGNGSNGVNTFTFVYQVRPVDRNSDSSTFALNGTGSLGGDTNWRLIDLNLGTSTTGTTTATGTGTITVYGDVVNAASHIFNAASKTYYFYQDFNNAGTFTGSTSTVNFQNSDLISILQGDGTTVFNNLTVDTAGKELRFTAGDTFRVNGLLSVTGSEANPVIFTSTSASQWYINQQGTESISYLDLSYGGCDPSGENIDAYNGTNINSGNNGTCWLFVLAVYHGGGGPTELGPGSNSVANGGTSSGPGGPPTEETGTEPGSDQNSGNGSSSGGGGGASP